MLVRLSVRFGTFVPAGGRLSLDHLLRSSSPSTFLLLLCACLLSNTPHESMLKTIFTNTYVAPTSDELSGIQSRLDKALARAEIATNLQDDVRRLQQELDESHQRALTLVSALERDAAWFEKERARTAAVLESNRLELSRHRGRSRRAETLLAKASNFSTSQMVSQSRPRSTISIMCADLSLLSLLSRVVTVAIEDQKFDVSLPSDGAFFSLSLTLSSPSTRFRPSHLHLFFLLSPNSHGRLASHYVLRPSGISSPTAQAQRFHPLVDGTTTSPLFRTQRRILGHGVRA